MKIIKRHLGGSFTLLMAISIFLVNCGGGNDNPTSRPPQPPPASTKQSPAKTGGATISGKVNFTGTPPRQRTINFGAELQCAKLHPGKVKNDRVVMKIIRLSGHLFTLLASSVRTLTHLLNRLLWIRWVVSLRHTLPPSW